MKHAEVKISGMTIPLIGIPPEAMLEECDDCHDLFGLSDVVVGEDGRIRCGKCKTTQRKGDE